MPSATLVELLARAAARIFYRVDVVGSVPATGPVLLLPNHPNALLDPALVMATAGRSVRFLAKSTLFDGAFAPLLRAARAIPVYRRQDASETARNAETFAAVDRALADDEVVCVFPEGISHSTGRLEPLRTGAARMTLSALAAGVEVQLVPVGVNLESKTVFRSRALIAYGTPFTPTTGDVRILTEEIATHLRQVMIEADPLGDAAIVDRVARLYRQGRDVQRDPASELVRRRTIAAGLQRLRRDRPEWYDNALVQFRRYDDRMRRFGLHDAALDWPLSTGAARAFVARELPLAFVLAPIAALALVTFAIPYAATAAAARLSREMDVTATVKVLGGVALYAIWTAVVTAAAALVWGAWAGAGVLLALPALAAAGLFAIERETSAWHTARAWLSLRSAQPVTRSALKRRRAELSTVLDEMHEWLAAGE